MYFDAVKAGRDSSPDAPGPGGWDRGGMGQIGVSRFPDRG